MTFRYEKEPQRIFILRERSIWRCIGTIRPPDWMRGMRGELRFWLPPSLDSVLGQYTGLAPPTIVKDQLHTMQTSLLTFYFPAKDTVFNLRIGVWPENLPLSILSPVDFQPDPFALFSWAADNGIDLLTMRSGPGLF